MQFIQSFKFCKTSPKIILFLCTVSSQNLFQMLLIKFIEGLTQTALILGLNRVFAVENEVPIYQSQSKKIINYTLQHHELPHDLYFHFSKTAGYIKNLPSSTSMSNKFATKCFLSYPCCS